MAFRIKNLMIAVLPEGGPGPLRACDGCTRIQCSDFPEPSIVYGYALMDELSDLRAAELLLLKAELRLALRRIESQQPIARVPEQPKTVQEIDLLEKHLQEALEELRGQRDRLAKEEG